MLKRDESYERRGPAVECVVAGAPNKQGGKRALEGGVDQETAEKRHVHPPLGGVLGAAEAVQHHWAP